MRRFDVKKYIKCMRALGKSDRVIQLFLDSWAYRCNGKTEEQMHELGKVTKDEWMEGED